MCRDNKPDPQIAQSARDNADLSREALAYFKQRDAEQQPRQAQMDELAGKLGEEQLASSQFNDQQARDLWSRYKSVGVPAEDAMYNDARTYDSHDNQELAAGQAGNDVAAAQAAAREAQQRQLARSGVNPADGRALAIENEGAAQDALGQAQAMNGARQKVRDMGIMLRKDAAGFARGMPGTAAQTFGVSQSAGGQAVGAAGAPIGSANSTAALMGQGFGIGINGNQSAGSILGNIYAAQTGAQTAQNNGMAGTAASIGVAI